MREHKLARYLFAILLLAFTLSLWHYKLPPFYQISLKFNDLNYYFNTKYPDTTVEIVVVDEKSVNKYGRWPWDRKILAEGLKKLSSAKAVGLDIVFSEPSSEASDVILAKQIKEQGNVIGGFFLRPKASEQPSANQLNILADSAMERLEGKLPFYKFPYAEINIELILKATQLSGSFSTLADKDELFRRYPVGFVYQGSVYPSLGLQLLRYSLNQDAELLNENGQQFLMLHDIKISLDDDGFALLNFHPLKSYNLISFADVLENKIPSGYFDNKIVIVGISEAGLSDIRATPLGQIPGPILHATFISNVLQGSTVKLQNSLQPIFIIAFFVLPLLMQFLVKNISYRMSVYFITYTMFFCISVVLYVAYSEWIETFYPLLALSISLVLNEFITYRIDEKESKFIKGAFANYMSQDLLEQLVDRPEKLSLNGEEKELSILFSDIRDFTTISENLDSKSLVSLLNSYFNPLTKIIQEEHGTVDKFIGDAIMAFFNAPLDCEDHPSVACRCALRMQISLKELNREFDKLGKPHIEMGIGINTANVTVGNMGSDRKFNYTAIGDGVNIASRLEGLNKIYETNIIISESTKSYLDEDEFLLRALGGANVKGKLAPVNIYELLDNNEHNQKKCNYFQAVYDGIVSDQIKSEADDELIKLQQTDNVGYKICINKLNKRSIDARSNNSKTS
jgi:adenylate cyclase